MTFGDGIDSLPPWRIDQANQPEKHQLAINVRPVQDEMALGNHSHAEREHALTLCGDGLHLAMPAVGIERLLTAMGRPLTCAHG